MVAILKLADQYTFPVNTEDTEMVVPDDENINFHNPLELMSGLSPGYMCTLLSSTFEETGAT